MSGRPPGGALLLVVLRLDGDLLVLQPNLPKSCYLRVAREATPSSSIVRLTLGADDPSFLHHCL